MGSAALESRVVSLELVVAFLLAACGPNEAVPCYTPGLRVCTGEVGQHCLYTPGGGRQTYWQEVSCADGGAR